MDEGMLENPMLREAEELQELQKKGDLGEWVYGYEIALIEFGFRGQMCSSAQVLDTRWFWDWSHCLITSYHLASQRAHIPIASQ